MSHEVDVSFLDKQEINQKLFPKAFTISNTDFNQTVSMSAMNFDAYFVDVDEFVRLCCRFYAKDKDCPSILHFHGNDETILDHSSLSHRCPEMGINLFMTDYRGYGLSDGVPNMGNLLQDCHQIYSSFKKILKESKYNTSIFVMGRSLGSIPAIELAYHYQQEIKGLIIESGSGQNFKAIWDSEDASKIGKLNEVKFYNKDKIKEITIPTLIIHGEKDNLIPVQIGQAMHRISGAKDKKLLIIPEAGHSDVADVGNTEYFSAIEKFVKKKPRATRRKKTTTRRTKRSQ